MGAVEFIQQLLPEEGFAVGKWSIADAAVTPFLARGEVILKNDIGKYEEGKGKAAWAKVESDPKYARFRKYLADVKSRDSFKETFYPVGFSLLLSDLQSFEPHSCNRTMSRKALCNPWLTTTRMESCPFTDGRSIMKSIEQFAKG